MVCFRVDLVEAQCGRRVKINSERIYAEGAKVQVCTGTTYRLTGHLNRLLAEKQPEDEYRFMLMQKGFRLFLTFSYAVLLCAGIPSLTSAERHSKTCLLYTSDAADERSSVDLGGRRIIKKKI